jgi:uncharacterized protein YbdZ (MbtH family)
VKDDEMMAVVVNEEVQYSIWPAEQPVPAGGWMAKPAPSRNDLHPV